MVSDYRTNNHTHNFTKILSLLSSLREFWTKVRSKYKEYYLQELKYYELNINEFCAHGTNTIFADVVSGDD